MTPETCCTRGCRRAGGSSLPRASCTARRSGASHSPTNRQAAPRGFEPRLPDPEREKRYAGATYKTNTNREIVSSVCCESTRWMSELVLVCSTQVTSQPSMDVADDTRRVSRQVGRSARRVGEARCVVEWCEDVRRVHRGLRECDDLARRGRAEHKPSRCDDGLQPSTAAATVQGRPAAGPQEREARVLPGGGSAEEAEGRAGSHCERR